MGLQGPLTAQALGRSPYDPEMVQGEGEDEASSSTPRQQYDARGRPINPESKRINRDIIRSHNEVMLLVGVAEAENQPSAAENESKRQHDAYENAIGARLTWATKRCVEMVGVFGVNGLRERILIYKHYAHSPCFELYSWKNFDISMSRDILPGIPANLLANWIDRRFTPRRFVANGKTSVPSGGTWVDQAWTYVRLHLELYAAFQRLGLVPSTSLLPSWRWFVPFAEDSLIPMPPPPVDYSPQSLLGWFGAACISATPFVAWAITRRLARDWQFQIWHKVLVRLPNPMIGGRDIGPLPPPRQLPVPPQTTEPDPGPRATVEEGDSNPPQATSETSPPAQSAPELTRRQSVFSTAGGDDFGSDDEDNEVISATLVSFDVEATEAQTDMPSGLWSAELRLSSGPESRPSGTTPPTYLSTMLTRMPVLMATRIITESLLRLSITPWEAMSLRIAARAFCIHRGLSVANIFTPSFFTGLNLTWLVNYMGVELMQFALSGEVWSMFTTAAQYLHKNEQEWEEFDGKDWADWFGPFEPGDPLS